MIESFRHKGLRRLFEADDRSRVGAEYVSRLRLILSALDAARDLTDMESADLPAACGISRPSGCMR
jgi:toxin HigB-1